MNKPIHSAQGVWVGLGVPHADSLTSALVPEDQGQNAQSEPMTVFEVAGGLDYFVRLVDRFYDRVATDDLLRVLYPEDLTEARRHTALFLAQYWGGPTIYNEERGHPRLRMRHAPFVIGQPERDAWLAHMLASVADEPVHPQVEEMFIEYFERASTAMMNH